MTEPLEPTDASEAVDATQPAVAPAADAPPPADASPTAERSPTVEAPSPAPRDRGDAELLALIDRLAVLLDRSDLTELEVESGATGLILRKPAAIAALAPAGPGVAVATVTAPVPSPAAPGEPSTAGRDPATVARPSVKAPLTGIFYASPAPGSAPYVQAGGEVAVGQLIGLIEAMKLFNEIKSDLAGRVVKVVPESGTLVKAKQPLIEVDPL
jgi:acetyl-CoA carboxylase biotin carboxyl carrier protein